MTACWGLVSALRAGSALDRPRLALTRSFRRSDSSHDHDCIRDAAPARLGAGNSHSPSAWARDAAGDTPVTFSPSNARRNSWPFQLAVAAGSMTSAVLLTHALRPFLQQTPYVLGFAAAVLSSRIGGRRAGLAAVAIGAVSFAWFPPLAVGADRVLMGFVVISGGSSWIVARRYEIEAELRASEARLTEAQTLAHVGSWEWNVADDSAWWSEEFYRICGLEPDSFTPSQQAFMAMTPADERAVVDAVLQRIFSDHQPFQFEHRIVRPDGGTRVLNSHGRVVVDAGHVVRIIGASQDITGRKTDEDIVRRSELRLQTIIDAEPACVKLVSRDGVLLDMNRAGLEMIGATTVDEIKGQPVSGLVHPED